MIGSISDIVKTDLSDPRLLGPADIVLRDESLFAARAPDYQMKAVHFDGSTWLINAALTSVDNGKASWSYWVKDSGKNQTHFVVDPAGAYNTFSSSGGTDTNFEASVGDASDALFLVPDVTHHVWHHILVSADVRRATPVLALYVDGVLVGQESLNTSGAFTGGSFIVFNGQALHIGADTFGDNLTGDVGDPWIFPGIAFLDDDGHIPDLTREKFRSAAGKPVYLGANGEVPTGIAPPVFLSGDRLTFAANKGTGGAFVTTGALTDADSTP